MTDRDTADHAEDHMDTTAAKLADLRAKLELAKEPAGEKAVAKRAKKGIFSPRERLAMLFDRVPSSRSGPWPRCPAPPRPDTATAW